ncbi:arrestin domain-containing protein 3-like [Osmia bicornis bicornis]|uniref:arrestin domain-containing protein 3-like n=1 Tax=Osmia bicornis bicornis TaxID=1437191 RepID=UPI001EAED345|nr:arrestin domain-containing protein 3-like [Osmia bicornis bicornis]
MSLRQFCVEFDRSSATYAAGETVTGRIIVDVAREKIVRGLFLSVKGEAHVRWTEHETVTRNKERHTRTIIFTNSEEYFSFKYSILGNQNSSSRVKIPEGQHTYQFSFQLPQHIPSSFEHQYGHVRYTVKAVIDRPWKFDHQSKRAFTVVTILDLNAHREICLGIDDEIQKEFHLCCCLFSKGKLNSHVRVPITGYVPGQTIESMIDYQNLSPSVQMTKISVKLERALTFHSSFPHHEKKRENTEIKSTRLFGPFPTNGQKIMELLVPPIPPSNLEFCSILDLEYRLVVTIHVSGMHSKISRSYPILIGTIPLYSFIRPDPITIPMPMPPTAPFSPADEQLDTSSKPPHSAPGFVHPNQPSTSTNWDNIPPPSYEECMSRADNIKDQDESSYVIGASDPFAPKYPVFNYPVPNMPRQ